MILFRRKFKMMGLYRNKVNETLSQFTSFDKYTTEKKGKQKEEVLNIGRSWLSSELDLKSNDDLHKLWYVLIKEKNSVLSDENLQKRVARESSMGPRLQKIEKSLNRIWGIIMRRRKVRSDYRKYLEDLYTLEKKKEYKQAYKKQQQEEEMCPPITNDLLVAKYKALKYGNDNLDYIEKYVKKQQLRRDYKKYLRKKYDYKNKKIVPKKQYDEMSEEDKKKHISQFESHLEVQLQEGKKKIGQEEVLRAHVINWKSLDLVQRRSVVNVMQARRARDARNLFQQELEILKQKIDYENKMLKEKQNLDESKNNQ